MPFFTLAAAKVGDGYTYLRPGGVTFSLTALIVGLLIGGLLACIVTVFYNRGVLRFITALRKSGADSQKTARTLEELGIRQTPSLRHALRARSSLIRKLISVALPDGTVLAPIRSRDDTLAEKEAEASAIHAEGAKEKAEDPLAESAPADAIAEVTAEAACDTAADPVALTDPGETDETALIFDPATATYFLDDTHRRRAELRFDKRGNDLRVLIPAIIAFVALIATLPIYLPYVAEALDAVLTTILGG